MTKSQVAFEFSCNKLFARFDPVYYWTLTFKDAHSYWRYPPKWHYLQNALCGDNRGSGLYPGLQGIRVLEVHPGGDRWYNGEQITMSHGLHYHLLVSQKIDIDILARIGERIGLGFTWVERVRNPQATARYLMKYLSKDGPQLLRGMRKWQTFGGFNGSKINNIKIDSTFHQNISLLYGGRQTEYYLNLLVQQITAIHGRLCDWPEIFRRLVAVCNTLPETIEKNGKYMKRKLVRQMIHCPNAVESERSSSTLVFWSANDAKGWATQNGVEMHRVFLCAYCGAIHAEFRDIIQVPVARCEPNETTKRGGTYPTFGKLKYFDSNGKLKSKE
jgi:hypothetical protein